MAKVIVDVKLGLKPFSANKMHYMRAKRDTKEYREFKGDIAELLGGEYNVSPKARLKLTLVSGFSNKASDLDNTFKPLLDSMQRCMGFDDKQIYEICAYKDLVGKGEEYLMIKLEQVPNSSVLAKINRLLRKFT